MFMQKRQSIAAGDTVYPFQGNVHEFLGTDALVEVAVNGAATGLEFDLIIGSRTVVQGANASEINRVPQYPEDFAISGPGLAGEKVTLAVKNTTAGAVVCFSSAKINPA